MEITVKDLKKIQSKASARAIQLNKALGLPYIIVRNGMLIAVDPEGREKLLRKAVFGTRTVKQKRIKLKNGH